MTHQVGLNGPRQLSTAKIIDPVATSRHSPPSVPRIPKSLIHNAQSQGYRLRRPKMSGSLRQLVAEES